MINSKDFLQAVLTEYPLEFWEKSKDGVFIHSAVPFSIFETDNEGHGGGELRCIEYPLSDIEAMELYEMFVIPLYASERRKRKAFEQKIIKLFRR